MPQEIDRQPEAPQISALQVVLSITTAIALVGCALLALYAHTLSNRLNSLHEETRAVMAKMGEQIAQNADDATKAEETLAESARESAAALQRITESETRKTNATLSARIAAQTAAAQADRKQVATKLDELKQANSDAASQIDSIHNDVSDVREGLAAHQTGLDATGEELKRVNGDMGVMSGRIATNARELGELRELGERNYLEFDLKRTGGMQKVGNLQLALERVDPKHNRYTMEVVADDKRVEKRDRTVNEPVQLYVSGSRQPVEIVVNEVKKDEVVGYVALPKVKTPRP